MIDTNKVGYHRERYSHFTSHQDKLVCHRESAPSSPPRPQRTPEKKPTPIKSPLSPQFRLFPEKCVFCESKCKRVPGKNPVFCKPFPARLKGKDPSWKNLADQVLTMGNTRLYRKLKNRISYIQETEISRKEDLTACLAHGEKKAQQRGEQSS